jgi:AAA domain
MTTATPTTQSQLPTLPSCREYLFNHGRMSRGTLTVQELTKNLADKHAQFGGCKNSPLSPSDVETIAVGVIALTPASKPKRRSSLTHAQLKELVKNAPGDLVAGLIPERSVNILVGDSGLGKTPLLGQLAITVAAGISFLGYETRRAVVLYVDYENGSMPFDSMLDTLVEFLALTGTPDTFRYLHQPNSVNEVVSEIRAARTEFPELPILVIVDSMRGFDPKMESKNDLAGDRITQLQSLAEELNMSMILIHHIKKDNNGGGSFTNPLPSLADSEIMDWLQRASGARAVVNQTNVRFGIDKHQVGSAELMIKGHYKLRGPFGPIQLARKYSDGVPFGYERLTGVNLLSAEQRGVFAKLPDEFRFSDVEEKSGKGSKTVVAWLLAWGAAGVVEKRGTPKSKNVRYLKLHGPLVRKGSQGSDGVK